MHETTLLAMAIFVLAYGLISRRLDGKPLTAPMLAVSFGILVGPYLLGMPRIEVEGETTGFLAELTLALVLFHDAARIDLRLLRKNLSTPARLLGPGLTLTVVLGFGLGLFLLPGLSAWEVALLAALLAPTDAALGQAVVTQESVPARERQALNVESGLNDGLIVPLVAVLIACSAGEESESAWTWIGHAAQAAGFGVGVGVLVGLLAARLLDAAEKAEWMHHGARRVGVFSVPIIAFFGAEAAGGSGFLAAFIGGIAMGSTTHHIERHLYDFTEDAGELLGHMTWIVFGMAAAPFALECLSPSVLAYALLSLTVVRILPVAVSLVGAGFSAKTVFFLGWFGPRGLASVVFAITVVGDGRIAGAEQIFGVAVWTVLLSVLLHGMTAAPLARLYGRSTDEDPGADVPEFPVPRASRS